MTRVSILVLGLQVRVQEYAEAIRERYLSASARRFSLKASKIERGRILDEFTKVTGCHRKAAIRLIRRVYRKTGKKQGRPRQYDAAACTRTASTSVTPALRSVWEATDRLCSKRLQPFLPELITVLRRHGESTITDDVAVQLCQMSSSTIDRLLRSYRWLGGRKPFSTTKPASLLKSSIPIRTFTEWQENRPGFLEVDLVAHCGESTNGFYLNILSTVDVASGWSECIGVWGKGQERVGAAVHRVRQRLPVLLLGLDSDNGSDPVLNTGQHLFTYCQREGIIFTRSR
jgi:hypothetical protein